MDWVRTHIRLGTRLALIALALHFVVAFGHFHRIVIQSAVLALTASDPAAPDSGSDSDDSADTCTICAVMAMADAMLGASPPALPLRQATAFTHSVPDLVLIRSRGIRTAFHPRAPPAC
ncbi:hypothetical protein DNX69_23310 [Rhodopseudomonas palustris]|uniref:DUF2946 domain-containing protein n=1 Tax=Rhodopseudomonas palustris TaxID=1076 RepID=A0A323UP59_RHOPL|nr:hypothetical protein [Rhodopseudomonas palustris]PZA09478.1 hypothetical protein DNX69_23310 [Rhodopseudomonas palustris]